jgi:DNA-binding beta-propeller fold protein YncE
LSSAEAGGALDDALEQQYLDGHEANQMTETYDEDFLSEPSTNFDFRFEFAWGSQGKFADTFSGPMGMAYDASSDVIFMSDSNNHRLQAVHVASQRMLWSWGVVGESGDDNYHFNQPRDCCLSPDHSLLYVVDSYNHRIVVLRAMDGQYLYQFGSKGSDNDASFNTPWAVMAVDQLLFVTDVYNHRVVVFQANVLGNKKASPTNPLGLEFRYCGQIGITGEAGSGLNTLNTPRGLAAYADRLLFIGDVKNARVQVFDLSTLSFVHSIGVSVAPGAKAEDGELMGPRGVAVDTKHKLLFVADTDQSSVVVFCASSFAYRGRIGPNINNSDVSASPELKLQKPKHVAIDSVRARIFVSDYSAHRVHVWQARPRK